MGLFKCQGMFVVVAYLVMIGNVFMTRVLVCNFLNNDSFSLIQFLSLMGIQTKYEGWTDYCNKLITMPMPFKSR